MKIKASLLALSLATTGAVAAPQAVAQEAATKTMAELYDPTLTELHKPFGSAWSPDTSEQLLVSGIPDNAKITVLPTLGGRPLAGGEIKSRVLYHPTGNRNLWIQIFENHDYPAEGVEIEPKILVSYPDGSTEIFQQTLTVFPLQKYSYTANLPREALTPGKQVTLPVLGLPEDARVTLLDASADWNASIQGQSLSVTPETDGEGQILLNVVYADGSSEVANLKLTASETSTTPIEPEMPTDPTDNPSDEESTHPTELPDPNPKPKPDPNEDPKDPSSPPKSGGKLPTWVIAIITASVLAVVGGIAAYLLPRLTR